MAADPSREATGVFRVLIRGVSGDGEVPATDSFADTVTETEKTNQNGKVPQAVGHEM